jgi:hypothetical protein
MYDYYIFNSKMVIDLPWELIEHCFTYLPMRDFYNFYYLCNNKSKLEQRYWNGIADEEKYYAKNLKNIKCVSAFKHWESTKQGGEYHDIITCVEFCDSTDILEYMLKRRSVKKFAWVLHWDLLTKSIHKKYIPHFIHYDMIHLPDVGDRCRPDDRILPDNLNEILRHFSNQFRFDYERWKSYRNHIYYDDIVNVIIVHNPYLYIPIMPAQMILSFAKYIKKNGFYHSIKILYAWFDYIVTFDPEKYQSHATAIISEFNVHMQ